jgi:4-hydroxy-tetrahydrodipicolinate reductase
MRIGVAGACGRMGNRILALAAADESLEPAGAVERTGHPRLGTDLGPGLGLTGPLLVTENCEEALAGCDVLIDFSSPDATVAHARAAAKAHKPMVIGTTGLDEAQTADLNQAASEFACVYAPNMSMGINVLCKLVAEAARALGLDYNVEITEIHHRFKRDAPSGTAKRLAAVIAEQLGLSAERDFVYGREGITGERPRDQVAVHALRGGDVVGDHTVTFAGDGERIELVHRAQSRDIYARGALVAAKFVVDKQPGMYDMSDVLGLR